MVNYMVEWINLDLKGSLVSKILKNGISLFIFGLVELKSISE